MFLLGGQSLSTVYQRRSIRDLGYENMTFETAESMNNTMYEYRFLRENISFPQTQAQARNFMGPDPEKQGLKPGLSGRAEPARH